MLNLLYIILNTFIKFVECCYLLCTGFGLDRREDALKFAGLASVNQYHAHVVARTIARIESLAAYVYNICDVIVAVKIAKKCGIFWVHRAICAITCVSTDYNSGAAIIFHAVECIDSHLPLKARYAEHAVIHLLGDGAKRGIGHNNVHHVAGEWQQGVLRCNLTEAKFAEICEACLVNVIYMDDGRIDRYCQCSITCAWFKHIAYTFSAGTNKLSHNEAERRRCGVLLLDEAFTVTGVEAWLYLIEVDKVVVG